MSLALTSTTLLVLAGALAVVLPVLGVVLWHTSVQRRRSSLPRTVGRWLLLVVGQGLAIGFTFLVVNNIFSFYTSWDDLLGSSTDSTKITSQGR